VKNKQAMNELWEKALQQPASGDPVWRRLGRPVRRLRRHRVGIWAGMRVHLGAGLRERVQQSVWSETGAWIRLAVERL
jgi:hypothetical protein